MSDDDLTYDDPCLFHGWDQLVLRPGSDTARCRCSSPRAIPGAGSTPTEGPST